MSILLHYRREKGKPRPFWPSFPRRTAAATKKRTAVAIIFALSVGPIWAQDVFHSPQTLKRLSVEELLDVDVTSVSKYPEKLSTAAGAIAVLTQEDLARAGVNNLPDALRLIPGLEVARVDAHTWAISARGFNDIFANKLLVMMDGRTIYTPLFSGVFWEVQDTLLEDIDRIEVVRGPGATLWGANAVNGVINIITKNARDTQGWLVSAGGGSEVGGFASVRYGGTLAEDVHFRVYAKYFARDSSELPSGAEAHDSWDMVRGGFRLDWLPQTEDAITLQGDIYSGREDEVYNVPTTMFPFAGRIVSTDNVAGGNLLGRWTRTFSTTSEFTIQAYYDRTVRNSAVFAENRDTGDVDLQYRFNLGDRNNIVVGAAYRVTHDNVRNSLNVALIPTSRTLNLFSAFVQDEITLIPERLNLTLGSKFEHNDFTGFEVQPSVRLLWTPGYSQTIWASVSRAVRTPSVAESDLRLNAAPPVPIPPGLLTIFGNPNLQSEELLAYELGYRIQPIDRLKIDIALFYNDYDSIRNTEPILPSPISPAILSNNVTGETYGTEISVTTQISDRWRLTGNYTLLKSEFRSAPGSRDRGTPAGLAGFSPEHQFSLRSQVDLPGNISFDSTLRYVDSLPGPRIPSYVTIDARLAWSPRKNLEFAIVGRNLLDASHPEFAPTSIGTQRTEVNRSVYATVLWRY